ncbi:uncharacterized protein LOC108665137 [Hyalella azteca]|uniref:Uncharacterized protein LOC108665137 n=1 Tax=Hyalella azteca TaxID=294128 RepID=A0A979FWS7_HYAAZ|nr:uncharacterized protein LOC108665137 [Hyalella azteca]
MTSSVSCVVAAVFLLHQLSAVSGFDNGGCTALPPVLDNSRNQNTADGVYTYTCNDGFFFLSGATEQNSSCSSSKTWTDIYDICAQECPWPRHCADVQAFGINDSASYQVIPSGDPADPPVNVWCELEDQGGGWTRVYCQKNSCPAPSALSVLTSSSCPYSIGLDNWQQLTGSTNSSEAAVVMNVELTLTGGGYRIATYDNVTIGPSPDYKLLSIGNYHGDAGDALWHSLGVDFLLDWWTPWIAKDNQSTYTLIQQRKGSFLKPVQTAVGCGLLWGSVSNIQMAQIYIRPKSVDENTSCPLMLNGDVDSSSWNATTSVLNFPHDRMPGANLSYKCLGEFNMEGNVIEDRTFQGNVTCLSGNPPRWDRNITLPCSFGCTDGYVESRKADECYKFMEDPKATSFLNAAYLCTAQGANLVRLQYDNLNDDLVSSGMNSYTAHGDRYNYDNPDNASSHYVCASSSGCDVNSDSGGCTILYNSTAVVRGLCSDTRTYGCMKPAACPTKYKRSELGGSCYYISDGYISSTVPYSYFLSQLATFQQNCRATGGALARPTSRRDLESLVGFIRKSGAYPSNVLLGLPGRQVKASTVGALSHECFPGYFINGNTSNPVGQRYWCVGNAGNWRYDHTKYPELQNCSKVPAVTANVEVMTT